MRKTIPVEEVERVIEDLETKRDFYKKFGDVLLAFAFSYAIQRLKELIE